MLKEDFTRGQLLNMAREIASYNGMFEEIGYAEPLDDFVEMFDDKTELIRAWYYGEADYNDDYFTIDSSGNIKSFTENELLDECEDNRDDIVEEYTRLVQENNIDDNYNYVDNELLKELGH